MVTSYECNSVSDHRQLQRSFNDSFMLTSKKTPKLCIAGHFLMVTAEFPSQMTSNAERIMVLSSRMWRFHVYSMFTVSLIDLPHTFVLMSYVVVILWGKSGFLRSIHIMTSSRGSFHRYWLGVRRIHRSPVNSLHKGLVHVLRTLAFLWYGNALSVKQTIERPVKWDYITSMWCHCNIPIFFPVCFIGIVAIVRRDSNYDLTLICKQPSPSTYVFDA